MNMEGSTKKEKSDVYEVDVKPKILEYTLL